MRSLSDHVVGRDNNFNLLRLVAATMVLVSHSYVLATGLQALEPLRWLPHFSLGGLAVDVFFVASGFLVAGSLLQRRDLLDFCVARGLRIFPGLWVALLLTIIIVGFWFTTLSPIAFFTDWQTWRHFLKNALLFRGISFELPGAFTDVPWSRAVNGSLWTLPAELTMYGWLASAWFVLLVARLNPEKWLRVFCCGVALVAIAADLWFNLSDRPSLGTGLLASFFAGASLRVLQRHVPASKTLFVALVGAMLLSTLYPAAFGVIYRLGIAYVVIYAALVPSGPIRKLSRGSDYSYGIYIYAFPVQQAIASIWHGVTPIEMMVSSFAVTLLFAVASWHLVEERALKLKGKVSRNGKAWLGRMPKALR
jgi:peptidoglycan/LPS O-acetylase OafA/YrhL